MSMNVGDVIYANNMAGDNGYLYFAQDQGTLTPGYTFDPFLHYVWNFNAICGGADIQVYNGGSLTSSLVIVEAYSNGNWVELGRVSDGDWGGYPSGVLSINLGTGSFRVRIILGGNSNYYWGHASIYRSYYAPRIRGNKLRTINFDTASYDTPGTSRITAALVNAGRVCTY